MQSSPVDGECAAALMTDRVLIYGEIVGARDLEMTNDVEHATPVYFWTRRSTEYLFLANMLA